MHEIWYLVSLSFILPFEADNHCERQITFYLTKSLPSQKDNDESLENDTTNYTAELHQNDSTTLRLQNEILPLQSGHSGALQIRHIPEKRKWNGAQSSPALDLSVQISLTAALGCTTENFPSSSFFGAITDDVTYWGKNWDIRRRKKYGNPVILVVMSSSFKSVY